MGRRGAGAALLALGLLGCAGLPPAVPRPAEPLELEGVPFFAQTTDQCGPAALATVLTFAGVDVTPEALRKLIYVPQRKGSLQPEMVAAIRSFQRTAYAFESRPEHLFDQLRDHRPVIVLQNLGARWLPFWHYAVVVGYRSDTDEFVMRSGNVERRTMRGAEFLRRWGASDFWGLVALAPGEIPRGADADVYLEAVSAHESLGQWPAAERGFAAAAVRWPDNPFARLGLANVYLDTGATDAAIDAYQSVLRLDPSNLAALNNLAYAHAAKGDAPNAIAAIDRVLAGPAPEAIAEDLRTLKAKLLKETERN